MADDVPPKTLPPMPQEFIIPQGAVERWLAIPERGKIEAPLTRQDLDNLFFSITNISRAMVKLQSCLLLYSQGKLDEANEAMAESQKFNIHGDNNIRMFMNAVMAAAKHVDSNNG